MVSMEKCIRASVIAFAVLAFAVSAFGTVGLPVINEGTVNGRVPYSPLPAPTSTEF